MKLISKIIFILILHGLFLTSHAQIRNDATLPVELVYFYAEICQDSIVLRFGTATEVSNFGFEIHRLQNSSIFEVIGFVDGNGNSNSPKDYSFTDSLVEMTGIVYYRLRQIDFDGTSELSDTVIVDFLNSVKLENSNIPEQFYVSNNYPNPFNPLTKFNFDIPNQQMLKINLYDLNGRLVKEIIDHEFLAGSYSLLLDFDNFSSGIYFVRFESQKNIVTKSVTYIK